MKQEIESKPFTIILSRDQGDGLEVDYTSTEETKYLWAIGMAGEIQIMKRIMHTTFSAMIREDRVRVYAAGEWIGVEVHDEDGEDDIQVDSDSDSPVPVMVM